MFKHALWGLWGVRNGFRLRIYGFTDLPPSLPLPPADPRTRITESSRRRSAVRCDRIDAEHDAESMRACCANRSNACAHAL
jgi:hypothetical protein